MRTGLILAASALFLPMLAWADVPPPQPDDRDAYTGPFSAHIAGLTFEHQRFLHVSPDEPSSNALIPDVPSSFDTFVLLADCDANSPNCKNAKALKAIGGAVTKIDATDIGDDVSKVESALANKGEHTLTIVPSDDVEPHPDTPPTIALVVSVP